MTESFIEIAISKDGGHTFGNWSTRSLGETGDFLKRVVKRRCGTGRHWTFAIRCTDPVCVDLLAGSIQIEGADG
jgi:hypothetical protein